MQTFVQVQLDYFLAVLSSELVVGADFLYLIASSVDSFLFKYSVITDIEPSDLQWEFLR